MENRDVRWLQRFANFNKALSQLSKFIDKKDLNELEEQGLIQCFEYSYELAWNTLKDFYEEQGEQGVQGSRDAFRLGFKRGLILDGNVWMDMVVSRTKTSHTYNEETAKEVISSILNFYYPAFVLLQENLKKLAGS